MLLPMAPFWTTFFLSLSLAEALLLRAVRTVSLCQRASKFWVMHLACFDCFDLQYV